MNNYTDKEHRCLMAVNAEMIARNAAMNAAVSIAHHLKYMLEKTRQFEPQSDESAEIVRDCREYHNHRTKMCREEWHETGVDEYLTAEQLEFILAEEFAKASRELGLIS